MSNKRSGVVGEGSSVGLRCAKRFLGLGLIVLLCTGGQRLLGAALVGEHPEQEQALRARVEDFYSLMQLGRWAQAEAYVTEKSKENFRNESKKPFLGFQVESVKLNPSGHDATVTVRIQVVTAFSPTTPMPFPRTTHWRLVDGLWYVVAPKPKPGGLQSVFGSLQGKGSSAAARRSEELKFKGHRYGLGTIQQGQVKVARFPFTNVTDHVVTLTAVLTGCECLRVKTEKKEYQPGESGEVVIEFDPTGYKDPYSQTIVVKTDPGGLTTFLTVHGYVVPLTHKAPKAEGEN